MDRVPESEAKALADEVFGDVEFDQGKGFVSDGLAVLKTRAEVFDAVRGHLHASRRVVRSLEAFLLKYGVRDE